jgi:hypothetical protein
MNSLDFKKDTRMTDINLEVEEVTLILKMKGLRLKKAEIIAAILIFCGLVLAGLKLYFMMYGS